MIEHVGGCCVKASFQFSLFMELWEGIDVYLPSSRIWSREVPRKLCFLIGHSCFGKILNVDNLIKRILIVRITILSLKIVGSSISCLTARNLFWLVSLFPEFTEWCKRWFLGFHLYEREVWGQNHYSWKSNSTLSCVEFLEKESIMTLIVLPWLKLMFWEHCMLVKWWSWCPFSSSLLDFIFLTSFKFLSVEGILVLFRTYLTYHLVC